MGTFQYAAPDTSTTELVSDPGAPDVIGTFYPSQDINISYRLDLGSPIYITGMYNVTDIINASTFTFGVVMRDMTTMPETTLTAFVAAVESGGAIASIKLTASAPGILSAVQYFNYSFVVGSPDSYGNIFSRGDLMAFDWGMYVNCSSDNVNATMLYAVFSPMWFQY
jgi:hypothetical protein